MTFLHWTVPGYSTVRELGSGAGGSVLLSRHDATGSQVAVKYLAEQLFADDGFRAAFRREARLLGEIDVPTVVRLFEYVESATGAAIVMELVDGVSLRTMLDQQGATEPESALAVLKGALLGLGAAHAADVLHRDFKPANVLLTADGASKLTDFGIAVRSGDAAAGWSGTPLYMAPEQWAGEPARPPADIYAATATFFECLAGEPPFPATDRELLRRQHEHASVPEDAVPAAVRGLVLRGMAKEPDRRPASVAAFLAELEEAAVAGYGADWEEQGRRGLARRAALLALLFPLAAGGTAGGTAIAETIMHGRRRRRVAIGAVAAALLVIGGGGLAIAVGPPTAASTVPGSPPRPAAAQPVAAAPVAAEPVPVPVLPPAQVDLPPAVADTPAGPRPSAVPKRKGPARPVAAVPADREPPAAEPDDEPADEPRQEDQDDDPDPPSSGDPGSPPGDGSTDTPPSGDGDAGSPPGDGSTDTPPSGDGDAGSPPGNGSTDTLPSGDGDAGSPPGNGSTDTPASNGDGSGSGSGLDGAIDFGGCVVCAPDGPVVN